MIGVVGSGPEAERIASAIEDAGESAVVGGASEVADASPTAIVAAGERALIDVAGLDTDAVVLPVDAGPWLGASSDGAAAAIDRLVAGEHETRSLPLLDVRLGGERAARAVFDVVLDTSEPSRISEYAVEAGGSTDRFRADGVVVATPAGSRGYANAAGGPVLDDGIEAAVVVPIAAFEIDADGRVVEPPIALTVERDECPVSLLVDGRERAEIGTDRSVEVSVGDALDVVDPRPGLEKL